MTFIHVLPEDYRATSIARRLIGFAQNTSLVKAIFIPTQDISISGDIEVFLRIIGMTSEKFDSYGQIRLVRGKFHANEPVLFSLNSKALPENTVLYIEKQVTYGQLALPESLVQIECR